MITINRLQVGNWIEHKGMFKQITKCIPNRNIIFLRGVKCAVNACDINEIKIYEDLSLVLSSIPDPYSLLKVIDYLDHYNIQYIHDLQNQCPDAKGIILPTDIEKK